MSQYQLALIDSLCPHCQGYLPTYPLRSINIENRWLELELERDAWLVSVVAASVVGPCRRARTHILPTGGFLPECASPAGV